MSTRTGTVRTERSARSSLRIRRSEDAGGAATSDGASARAGAGMNDEGRGFSAALSHAATGAPLDWTRGRDRRARFLSLSAAAFVDTRAGAAGVATGLATASTLAGFTAIIAG